MGREEVRLSSGKALALPDFSVVDEDRLVRRPQKRWAARGADICLAGGENALALVDNGRILAEVFNAPSLKEACALAKAQLEKSYGRILPKGGMVAVLNKVPEYELHLLERIGVDILCILNRARPDEDVSEQRFFNEWFGILSATERKKRALIWPAG